MKPPIMDDLMHLCEQEPMFRWKDHAVDGRTLRVFTYGYIDRESWGLPFARECRGHTFDAQTGDLLCLPMPKFFNLGERPETEVDIANHRCVMLKLDGSLVSTVAMPTGFVLKTKGAFESDQAMDSTEWLNPRQIEALWAQTDSGWTVNMEWVAPSNQIVVAYGRPRLVVLNRRHRETGALEVAPVVPGFETVETLPPMTADTVRAMEGSEGVVVQMANGELIKVKSDWYLERHRLLDMLASNRRWVEMCLNNEVDDVLSFVNEQPLLRERFDAVSSAVTGYMRWASNFVETFHRGHAHMERKDYALAGQALDGDEAQLFPLLMQRYTGRDPDIAGLGKRRMEQLILPHIDTDDPTHAPRG